jgi:hypothetical protein
MAPARCPPPASLTVHFRTEIHALKRIVPPRQRDATMRVGGGGLNSSSAAPHDDFSDPYHIAIELSTPKTLC